MSKNDAISSPTWKYQMSKLYRWVDRAAIIKKLLLNLLDHAA